MSNSGLAKLLEDRAVAQVVQKMRNELNDGVGDANAEVAAAQLELAEAGKRLDAAIKHREAATEALQVFDNTFSVPQRVVKYFHLGSRTDSRKKGHFIKTESDRAGGRFLLTPEGNVTFTCSCEAGQRNRECWAIRHLKDNFARGDSSWAISEQSYNRRESFNRAPYNASRY